MLADIKQLEARNASAPWLARASNAQLALEARPDGLDPSAGRVALGAAVAGGGADWTVRRAIRYMRCHAGTDEAVAAYWSTADALSRLATIFALPGWEAPYDAACAGLRQLQGAAAYAPL